MTRAQLKLLEFIERFIRENGVSPSFDEMAKGIGLGSKSGVHRLMAALEREGKVRRSKYAARSVEVVGMKPVRADGNFDPAAIAECIIRKAEDIRNETGRVTMIQIRDLIVRELSA